MTQRDERPDGLLLAVSAAIDLITARNNAVYDGVVGEPPDWIPPTLLADFRDARNRLLDEGHGRDTIVSWLRAYVDLARGTGGRVNWPAEVDTEMRALARVWTMQEDGPVLGMKRFLGDTQFKRVGEQDRRDQMGGINSSKVVPPETRALVLELHRSLSPTFKKKTALYEAIASQSGVKFRTVRYLIEGRGKT